MAETWTVDSCSDAVAGSIPAKAGTLRFTIANAADNDTIDLSDPPASVFAAPGDRPGGIYVWALLRSSAVAAEGIARVIVRLQQFPYERSDLFALPATPDGLRFMRGLGFRPVAQHPRALHRYVRVANRKDDWGG